MSRNDGSKSADLGDEVLPAFCMDQSRGTQIKVKEVRETQALVDPIPISSMSSSIPAGIWPSGNSEANVSCSALYLTNLGGPSSSTRSRSRSCSAASLSSASPIRCQPCSWSLLSWSSRSSSVARGLVRHALMLALLVLITTPTKRISPKTHTATGAEIYYHCA